MILEGWSPQAAAAACGMSRATAYRLLQRYRQDGWEGLRDRPPIAKRCPHRLSEQAEAQIVELRRRTTWGPRAIASALGRSPSTVWRVLTRHGLSRAERAPRPPANRYEYAAPGELVHLDTKKLGRFWQIGKRVLGDGVQRNRRAGWQHAHVAVDDHSRWGLVELRPREDAENCTRFLASVISAYTDQGITIRRVMTDNGSGYRSRRFRQLLRAHFILQIST
jgi:transposase